MLSTGNVGGGSCCNNRARAKLPVWAEGQGCQEPPQAVPLKQPPAPSEIRSGPGVSAPSSNDSCCLLSPLNGPELSLPHAPSAMCRGILAPRGRTAGVPGGCERGDSGSSPKCQLRRAELKEHACPLWRGGHPNVTKHHPARAFKYSNVLSGCL